MSKFTAFPDNKINENQKLEFVLGRVKNIVTLERPYELAPGQRYCPCQLYVLARVKNMAAPTRLHKVSTKTYFYYNQMSKCAVDGCRTECLGCQCIFLYCSFSALLFLKDV